MQKKKEINLKGKEKNKTILHTFFAIFLQKTIKK